MEKGYMEGYKNVHSAFKKMNENITQQEREEVNRLHYELYYKLDHLQDLISYDDRKQKKVVRELQYLISIMPWFCAMMNRGNDGLV